MMDEIIKKLATEIVRLNTLAQGLSENSANIDAKIIALVKLLADKRIITLEEFDREHEVVLKYMKDQLAELEKHPTERSQQ